MSRLITTLVVIGWTSWSGMLLAEEGKAADSIKLSDGKITLPVPIHWERKQPRTRIVEHEFAAKSHGEEAQPARVTVMGAGGGVEKNISRWIGQFAQPDRSSTRDKTKVSKSEIAGAQVHVVDITGTYLDRPGGPFSGGRVVPRKGYRMLGAIIVTKSSGHYFVKLLGEAKTVEMHSKGFQEMLAKLAIKS